MGRMCYFLSGYNMAGTMLVISFDPQKGEIFIVI